MDEWRKNILDMYLMQKPLSPISGIYDGVMRDQKDRRIKAKLERRMNDGRIDPESDTYNSVWTAIGDVFKNTNVAVLRPNVRFNLNFPKQLFDSNGVIHQNVAKGAYFLANNYEHKDLHFGIVNDEGFTPAKFEKLKQDTMQRAVESTGVRSDPARILAEKGKINFVERADKLKQQALEDLMAGNAPYIYTQLLPASQGKDGYYIGIFAHKPDQAPQNAELIGSMRNPDNTIHFITQQELIGASASDQILEYVTSWFFDYNHENIKKLFHEGKVPEHRIPGGGRAVETESMAPAMRRGLATLEGQMGEIEFNHAVDPLYRMMEAKAKEKFGDKYDETIHHLDEETAQDVLREFMDRFDRPYTQFFENEPLKYFKGAARWVNNFWELDLNLREIWN